MSTTQFDLQANAEQLNAFENFLRYKTTWLFTRFVHAPEQTLAVFAGNQLGKTAIIARSYVMRILGLHPVAHRNVLYFECGNGHQFSIRTKPKGAACPTCSATVTEHVRGSRIFRFASETLPAEKEDLSKDGQSAEIKNSQYPEFKKWLPRNLIKKDITFRSPSMILHDPHGGPDIVVEFVSYNQTIQQQAGVQRLSCWENEEAPLGFHEEQIPRLLAENGDLVVDLTPAERLCFDEQTEIITRRGWQSYDHIRLADEVLSYNIDRDCYEWVPIEGFYAARVENEYLFSMRSFEFDALVTSGHKWVVANVRNLAKRYLKPVEGLHTKERIKRLSEFVGDQDNPLYPDELIALVGWAVTDGTFQKRHRRIVIYQSATAYPEHCCRIRELLAPFGGQWNESQHEYADRIICGKPWHGQGVSCHFTIGGELALRIRSVTNGKTINQDFICSLSRRQLMLLFNAMIDGDGTRVKNGSFVFTQANNTKLMLDFQLLCTLLGKKSTLHEEAGYFARHGRHRQRVYVMCQGRRYSPDSHMKSLVIEKRLYTGMVWCPSTRNKTVVMRRNGCVSISGNTWTYDQIYERAKIYYRTPAVSAFTGRPQIERTESPNSIAVFCGATDDNPTLDAATIDLMFQGYDDPDVVAIRRYGVHKQVTGRIFKGWDSSLHVYDPETLFPDGLPHGWVHARMIDYHEHKPWACGWMAMSPEDEVFIYDEYAPSPERFVTAEIARVIASKSKDYRYVMNLLDPLAAKTQSNTGRSVQDDFNELFFQFHRDGIGSGGYWESWDSKSTRGRDEIRKRLKNSSMVKKPFNNLVKADGVERRAPTLWVARHCVHSIKSFRQWRLDEWSSSEALLTKDVNQKPQQRWSDFPTAYEAAFKDNRFRPKRSWSDGASGRHRVSRYFQVKR